MTSVSQRFVPQPPARVLIADPDAVSRAVVEQCLRGAGFPAAAVAAVDAVRPLLLRDPPRLLLLDGGFPGSLAVRFLAELRAGAATRDLPVIVFGGDTEQLAVAALDAGADDFLAKPFGMAEFLARVKAVLRRSASWQPGLRLEYDGLVLDRDAGRLHAGGRPVTLRPRDLQLAQFLLCFPEQLHPRETLRQLLSDSDRSVDIRSVDVQVCRLRSALEPFGYAGHLQTVHGEGYRLSRLGATPGHSRR